MRFSFRLVMTNLNFFRWSTWTQRWSVHNRALWSLCSEESCLRPPHSSNASITITGSSSSGTFFSKDNGVSMSNLKSWSMSDEMSFLLPWVKYSRSEGCRRARSQATARQRAFVVIVIDCVLSNRKYITCRCCSCSRMAMLAAKADFPSPGNPLIQITSGPSTLLISLSILVKMAVRVPSMHGLHRGSLFSPRALTKSSSSFLSAAVFAFFAVVANTNHKSVKLNDEYQPWRPDLVLLGSLSKHLGQKFPHKYPVSSVI